MLKDDFDRDMREIYRMGIEHGYYAHYFIQMIEEHGGVNTAKRLLAVEKPQEGLFRLYELGLLNESMEALVIKPQYAQLFSEVEISTANQRLIDLRYKPM